MVNGTLILEAIKEIIAEKQISEQEIIEGIKEGFKKAYERFFDTEAVVEVEINLETGMIELYQLLTVVQKIDDDWLEIGLNEAKEIYGNNIAIGDVVKKPIAYDQEFSRSAVHQVRQIVQQKIRNATREKVYNRFIAKKGELLTGKVVGMNEQGTAYLVDVEGTIASLWAKKMIPSDDFKIDDFLTFYVEDVEKDSKFSQIVGSRTAPGFLEKLLEEEIPEIQEGIIEIKAVSREPGVRSKVAVVSHDENVEPIGSIVGVKGNRINRVTQQLHGEKIDVIKWSEDPITFIINAMAPVKVISVDIDELENETDVIVPNEQLSLAIGKGGMAARLVANLLKIKINILSLTQAGEYAIPVKWNGNISPAEVESKEFLDQTQKRRQNNKNNFNQNNRRQQNSRFDRSSKPQPDLEELEAFQKEYFASEENQVSQTSPSETETDGPGLAYNVENDSPVELSAEGDQEEPKVLKPTEEVEDKASLEDIQANLKALEQAMDDETDDESEDDEYDDEYDKYYD